MRGFIYSLRLTPPPHPTQVHVLLSSNLTLASNSGNQVINLEFHMEEYSACVYGLPLLYCLACTFCSALFRQSPPAQRGFLSTAPIHDVTAWRYCEIDWLSHKRMLHKRINVEECLRCVHVRACSCKCFCSYYLLHTDHQNTHSASKVWTSF